MVNVAGVDLFAGAGGLSLGAKQAGIQIFSAVEYGMAPSSTYRRNFPDVVLWNQTIESISAAQLLNFRPPHGRLVVFGGPPCQGFSTSNQRTRSPENPNNWLFRHFTSLAKILEADALVLETVPGILQTANGLFVHEIERHFNKIGHKCSIWRLNAADFGVPQRRNRVFFIGCRGQRPAPPSPKPSQYVSVADAINDLPELCNGSCDPLTHPYTMHARSVYAKRMRGRLKACGGHLVTKNAEYVIERFRHIPPGANWRSIPADLMSNYADIQRCHAWIYHRLDPDSLSVAIGNFRKNMLIHPTQHRGLSIREAARLQSFPDVFEFEGTIGQQQQQVGNAVPPLLAQAVFEQVLTTLN